MGRKTVTGMLGAAAIMLLTGCAAQENKLQESQAVTENVVTEIAVTKTLDTETSDTEAAGSTEMSAAAEQKTDSQAGNEVSVAGWNITVEDVQKNASLENVSVELGYTGVEKNSYQKDAEDGMIFCLVKLLIEKDGSKENIDWDRLKLTDSDGNEYSRMEDEFLTDMGMLRMTGNTLNFGKNEGWIAFEIKENAEGLELEYPFETETYRYVL